MLFAQQCGKKLSMDLLVQLRQENHFMDNLLMNPYYNSSKNNHIFFMEQERKIELKQ